MYTLRNNWRQIWCVRASIKDIWNKSSRSIDINRYPWYRCFEIVLYFQIQYVVIHNECNHILQQIVNYYFVPLYATRCAYFLFWNRKFQWTFRAALCASFWLGNSSKFSLTEKPKDEMISNNPSLSLLDSAASSCHLFILSRVTLDRRNTSLEIPFFR